MFIQKEECGTNQGLFVEDKTHSSSLRINDNEHKNIWIRAPAEKKEQKRKRKRKEMPEQVLFLYC